MDTFRPLLIFYKQRVIIKFKYILFLLFYLYFFYIKLVKIINKFNNNNNKEGILS